MRNFGPPKVHSPRKANIFQHKFLRKCTGQTAGTVWRSQCVAPILRFCPCSKKSTSESLCIVNRWIQICKKRNHFFGAVLRFKGCKIGHLRDVQNRRKRFFKLFKMFFFYISKIWVFGQKPWLEQSWFFDNNRKKQILFKPLGL